MGQYRDSRGCFFFLMLCWKGKLVCVVYGLLPGVAVVFGGIFVFAATLHTLTSRRTDDTTVNISVMAGGHPHSRHTGGRGHPWGGRQVVREGRRGRVSDEVYRLKSNSLE